MISFQLVMVNVLGLLFIVACCFLALFLSVIMFSSISGYRVVLQDSSKIDIYVRCRYRWFGWFLRDSYTESFEHFHDKLAYLDDEALEELIEKVTYLLVSAVKQKPIKSRGSEVYYVNVVNMKRSEWEALNVKISSLIEAAVESGSYPASSSLLSKFDSKVQVGGGDSSV